MEYDTFFKRATGEKDGPFPYQRTLATEKDLFRLIHVPTGAGKTAAVILAWLWRRRFNEATKTTTPRRLVYCLPMRVLVEQTVRAAESWLKNLNLSDDVKVHVLMGGEETGDWDLRPEADAIVIGTQDMLLSRALNRGYGMSRYRWPMHFALLNNDCLWVMDEVQLMGSGLATGAQLEAFRAQFKTWGTATTIWMSATLRPGWLETVDFKDQVAGLCRLELQTADFASPGLGKRYHAQKPIEQAAVSASDKPEAVAQAILGHHAKASLTLVVVNTVDRAQALHAAIAKLSTPSPRRGGRRPRPTTEAGESAPPPEVVLIHSRFRPFERRRQMERLGSQVPEAGRIVVATQVVEAGVDISAKTLITELAPWASLVQRFGRCNRRGDDAGARVFWIDVGTGGKKSLAAPYTDKELDAARALLQGGHLQEVGPAALDKFLRELTEARKAELFPYAPNHVVRRKDMSELFDTTPDLAGNDIDIGRFIRDGEDLDVQVYWRTVGEGEFPMPGSPSGAAPNREELCPVPIYKFRDDFLKKKKRAFRWNVLDRQWVKASADAVIPGQVYLIPADQGGYTPASGWNAKSVEPVEDLQQSTAPPEGNDDDRPSQETWQSIAEHTNAVVEEAQKIIEALGLQPDWREALLTAARWHDRGKAHEVFQDAIHDGQPDKKQRPPEWQGRRDIAKAPREFWNRGYKRKHFRHELASSLAMIQAGVPDLAVYLAACHHGKVRLSIRSLPDEDRPPEQDQRFARGVWDDDLLPEVDLGGAVAAPVRLCLEPMELGRGENDQPSWAERMLRFRDDPNLGPFQLAFLEVVLRAADMRASAVSGKKGNRHA